MTDRPRPYGFRYTRKDLILYALSIGMGSEDGSADDDLRFLYEQHAEFTPIPTFCLTITFWANHVKTHQGSGRIPTFPPPLMAREQLIPKELLRGDDIDLSQYPVIHTWQSIVWETSLPIPSQDDDDFVSTSINLQTIAVQPKSVGAFVTTESQVTVMDPITKQNSLICTMQSTALVFGVSKDVVTPYNTERIDSTRRPSINAHRDHDTPPILEWTFPTSSTSALLYRIASGDSNHIHVDNSVSEQLESNKKAPLLHGLLSLAIAFRGILKVVPDADCRIRRLEAQFSQPAFVGDVLLVRIWRGNERPQLTFQIINQETGAILVSSGYAELGERQVNKTTRSRL